MSYVLKQVGKVWHYRFQINGVRVQRSTRETSRNKAAQVADRAWNIAKLDVRGMEDIPTVSELSAAWLLKHRAIMSEHYIRSVETITNLHMAGFGNIRIDKVTTEMIEDARLEFLKTHARISSNTWLNVLSVLFHWAIKRKLINEMPWKVSRLKVQKQPRVSLSTASIAPFLAAVDEYKNYGVSSGIRLMLGLGLRESEVLTARWEWIDWERKTYTPGKTKGFEAVAIPIAGWLMEWLEATKCKLDDLIVFKPYGTKYSAGFASQIIKSAGARVGLQDMTPHRLRGTFATLLSEQGVSIQNIQHVMRHKDSMTTMRYLEVNTDEARRGVNQIAQKAGVS